MKYRICIQPRANGTNEVTVQRKRKWWTPWSYFIGSLTYGPDDDSSWCEPFLFDGTVGVCDCIDIQAAEWVIAQDRIRLGIENSRRKVGPKKYIAYSAEEK